MPPLDLKALRGAPAHVRADALLSLLQAGEAADYIGEPVSQLAHALQAAELAYARSGDRALALAALLHDIGHLAVPEAPSMDGLGTVNHEAIGLGVLKALGCQGRIAEVVGGHVAAKRYLATTPGYLDGVSEASLGTLRFQGGPMEADEARAFEAEPLFEAMLWVRRCDEAAKVAGKATAGLETYRPWLIEALSP